jgi:predicted MFS family arabinose efflux permease
LGGLLAALLFADFGWREVFIVGSIVTLFSVLLTYRYVPETVTFLLRSRRVDSLERVNDTLRRLGHRQVESLPGHLPQPPPNMAAIFSEDMRRKTILITAAYLLHVITYYFILKWLPKISVDLGSTPAEAAERLAWVSVGGLLGTLAMGIGAYRLGLRTTTISALLLSTVLMVWLGQTAHISVQMAITPPLLGFFNTCGLLAIYAYMSRLFPGPIRATGIGFAMGVGRAGAALAPMVTGYLFAIGLQLSFVTLVIGIGSAIAAYLIFLLPKVGIVSR